MLSFAMKLHLCYDSTLINRWNIFILMISRESRCPSHESRSLIPIKKYMNNVIKTRLVVDK